MDVQTNAAPAGASPPVPDGPISAKSAGDLIAQRRAAANPPPAENTNSASNREPNGRFAAKESAPQADAAPTEVRSETEGTDPASAPSIDPPRSWSREDKELFASLPLETQQRLADRERSRESDFLKRQNDAAAERKAAETERQAAAQRVQQYDGALQNMLAMLTQNTEFADIKTPADLKNLAEQDPFRFNKWQAHQAHVQMVQAEANRVAQERQALQQTEFKSWSDQQDKDFEALVKDFADPEKAKKHREGIRNYLTEVRGVPADTLPGLWSNPLFRDARMQSIVYDAYRWNEAQKAAKAAVPKDTPPVLRSGATVQTNQGQDQLNQAMKRLEGAKGIQSVRAAADAIAAKRAAGARR